MITGGRVKGCGGTGMRTPPDLPKWGGTGHPTLQSV